MDHPHIEITTRGTRTTVKMNGTEIPVYMVRYEHGGRSSIPQLELCMPALNVTLDTDFLPRLPEPWNSFYVPRPDLTDPGNVDANPQE